MGKTTIAINGEECVILPAPKGAFIKVNCISEPDFIPFVAVNAANPSIKNERKSVRMYALRYYDDGYLELDCELSVRTEIGDLDLQESYEDNEKYWEDDTRELIMYLYQQYSSHGTHFKPSAIKWFKEKFKEYNITKADFDVFA